MLFSLNFLRPPPRAAWALLIAVSVGLSACANFKKSAQPQSAAPKEKAATTASAVPKEKAAATASAAPNEKAAAKVSRFSSLPKLPKLPDFSLASLLPGSRVKVVEVREKDLKILPTGHERALAYASKHKRGFWIFGGPVDFKEPTLPEPGSEMDGSLLPPRLP